MASYPWEAGTFKEPREETNVGMRRALKTSFCLQCPNKEKPRYRNGCPGKCGQQEAEWKRVHRLTREQLKVNVLMGQQMHHAVTIEDLEALFLSAQQVCSPEHFDVFVDLFWSKISVSMNQEVIMYEEKK